MAARRARADAPPASVLFSDRAAPAIPRTITTSAADDLGERAVNAQTSGDVDEASRLYEDAIDLEPMHQTNLANYALFMWRVRGDTDRAAALFKAATFDDGSDGGSAEERRAKASALSLYALFIHAQWQSVGGHGVDGHDAQAVAVERLHARAIRADAHTPSHSRGTPILRATRDATRCSPPRSLSALKLAPDDPTILASFAELLGGGRLARRRRASCVGSRSRRGNRRPAG